MKIWYIGIVVLGLVLIGCAPEEPTVTPETTPEPPQSTGDITDEQILAEYDDDLDAALEELDLIE